MNKRIRKAIQRQDYVAASYHQAYHDLRKGWRMFANVILTRSALDFK